MTCATAPGKIMLAGEYAVLEGGPAVLVALDRRVRATAGVAAAPSGDYLTAVAAEIAADRGDHSPSARAARSIAVDSTALCAVDGGKLGLGSSAAVTVAAVAASLAAESPTAPLDPAEVHLLAHRAHARAQRARGGRGSGADVAVCVHGGAVVVAAPGGDPDRPLTVTPTALPADLHLVLAWTGASADTAALLDRAGRFRDRHPDAWRRACDPVADAAAALARALQSGHGAAALTALADAGRAIAAFGNEVGIPIAGPVHRRLREIAEARGGTAKPTGAGVGDVVLAAFPDPDSAESFRHDATAIGITLVTAAVTADGFLVE